MLGTRSKIAKIDHLAMEAQDRQCEETHYTGTTWDYIARQYQAWWRGQMLGWRDTETEADKLILGAA